MYLNATVANRLWRADVRLCDVESCFDTNSLAARRIGNFFFNGVDCNRRIVFSQLRVGVTAGYVAEHLRENSRNRCWVERIAMCYVLPVLVRRHRSHKALGCRQFTLSTLLWATCAASVVCSCVGVVCARYRAEQNAARILERYGAYVWWNGLHVVTVLANDRTLPPSAKKALGAFPYLRQLNLANTGVTDQDLSVWPDLPQLEYLDLSGTRISDASVDRLTGYHSLLRLRVSNTRISHAGLQKLRAALPDTHVVGESDSSSPRRSGRGP